MALLNESLLRGVHTVCAHPDLRGIRHAIARGIAWHRRGIALHKRGIRHGLRRGIAWHRRAIRHGIARGIAWHKRGISMA